MLPKFAFFSSIGMTKAALEAIGGFNLFGKGHGATWSTIMVANFNIFNWFFTIVEYAKPYT